MQKCFQKKNENEKEKKNNFLSQTEYNFENWSLIAAREMP